MYNQNNSTFCKKVKIKMVIAFVTLKTTLYKTAQNNYTPLKNLRLK